MKKIGEEQDGWKPGIIEDLEFIKRKLRYRFKFSMTMPFIVAFPIVMIMLWVIFIVGTRNLFQGNWASKNILIPAISLFMYGLVITRYIASLKFLVVPTSFSSDNNRRLLAEFLKENHLLVFQHPESIDIFQIASRPIRSGDDTREILIFIVDDHRILINSHFTNTGWRIEAGKRKDKEMAKMLQHWLAQYGQNSYAKISV